MSSYLWQYYLEDDLESFERLLDHGESSFSQKTTPSRPKAFPAKLSSAASYHLTSPAAKHKNALTNAAVTRQMVRECDSDGRSLLHLAASDSGRLGFLRALLRHPAVDILQQDLESGWTPLHRALYNGNISAAREIIGYARRHGISWESLLRKDHAGDTPMELFIASSGGFKSYSPNLVEKTDVQDTDDEGEDSDGEGHSEGEDLPDTELFMFGSNRNLTLGFGDEDDRQYPELLTVPRQKHFLRQRDTWRRSYSRKGFVDENDGQANALTLFNPIRILDIQVGKFHSALITDDPFDNLFVCGYGVGGRLGLGENVKTQFTFKRVQGIGDSRERVIAVALGQDHTLALTNSGSVWAWGSNGFGQLGYTIKGIPGKAKSEENAMSFIPKPIISGLKREFIVGISASRVHSVAYTREAIYVWGRNSGQLGIVESGEGGIDVQNTPRKVAASFLTGNTIIRQVVASDKATSILLSSKEVFVLKDYGYFRVTIPPPAIRSFGRTGSSSAFKSQIRPTYSQQVSRIAGGPESLAVISTIGDVSLVDFTKNPNSGSSKKLPAASVKRVWDLRRRHMAVRDVGVDMGGNLIVCTESGTVWRRLRKVRAKDIDVAIGLSKSEDARFVRVPGLNRIVAVRGSGFGTFAAVRQDVDIMKKMEIRPAELPNILLRAIRAWPTLKGRPSPAPNSEEEEDETSLGRASAITGLEGADVVKVGNLSLPVFRYILAGRVPLLRRLFHEALEKGKVSFKKLLTITRTADYALELEFLGVSKVSVLRFLCILYGISYTEEWFGAKVLAGDTIANMLEVPELQESTWRDRRQLLVRGISHALEDPDYMSLGDTVIDLADGASVVAFSEILRLRSPYFDTLFGGLSDGFWIRERLTDARSKNLRQIHVDLKHVRLEVFKTVLLHMYTDRTSDLFASFKCWTFEELLDYVLDVMSVANELLLDRLAETCQCVLGSYVTIRNASSLLNSLSGSKVRMFHDCGLQYIVKNLDTMLENQLLDDLDDDLVLELDRMVRDIQLSSAPVSRSDRQISRLLTTFPNMLLRSSLELQHRIQAIKGNIAAAQRRAEESSRLPQYDGNDLGSRSTLTSAPPKSRKKKNPDLIFDMEDDSKDTDEPEIGADDAEDGNHAWEVAHSKSLKPKQMQVVMEESPPRQEFWIKKGSLTPPRNLQMTPPIETPPKKGWSIPFTPSPKVDLKTVLDAESPTAKRTSYITTALRSDPQTTAKLSTSTEKSPFDTEPSVPTPPKTSQKIKRHRLDLGQPPPTLPPLDAQYNSAKRTGTPESSSPSAAPWQVPTKAHRISLKDVLISESGPPLSRQSPRARASPMNPNIAHEKSLIEVTPSTSKGPELFLSMADIISQQEAEKDIIQAKVAKRSLEEIQQEQEFQEWWDKETERIRLESEAQAKKEKKRAQRGRGGGNNGKPKGDRNAGDTPKPTTSTVANERRSRGKGGAGRGRGRGRGKGEEGKAQNQGATPKPGGSQQANRTSPQ